VRMSGGQPSYSHVVTVSGTGKIVYQSPASSPVISTANCVGKGDMRAQMEQTFRTSIDVSRRPVRLGSMS